MGADSSIVFVPLLIMGLGIGALASQLGAVTVSAVPTEKSSEVGGLQNTASQLGASIGTALAGSVLIAVLTTSFLTGIQQNPDVPEEVKSQASVDLAAGVPFISNEELETLMTEAGAVGRTHRRGRRAERDSQIDRPAYRPRGAGGHGRHRPVLHRADSEAAAGFDAGRGWIGGSIDPDGGDDSSELGEASMQP